MANQVFARRILQLLREESEKILARHTGGEEQDLFVGVEACSDVVDWAQAVQEALNRLALNQRDMIRLDAITEALERWTKSPETADHCLSGEECPNGGEIVHDRLLLVPTARYCAACQARIERNGGRR